VNCPNVIDKVNFIINLWGDEFFPTSNFNLINYVLASNQSRTQGKVFCSHCALHFRIFVVRILKLNVNGLGMEQHFFS
jgi:hypothetical protein